MTGGTQLSKIYSLESFFFIYAIKDLTPRKFFFAPHDIPSTAPKPVYEPLLELRRKY